MKTPTFRDVELLSAYLDGQLPRADSARLETRLETDPNLRAVMDDLSQSRTLLRSLPQRRAPRNFTLTPRMARVKPPLPRAVPALRWATSLATLLLVVTFAANALSPSLASSAPMGYGMGGGGEEAPLLMEAAATEAPAAAPVWDAAATEEPLPSVSADGAEEVQPTQLAVSTPDPAMKSVSPELPPVALAQESQPVRAPIPLGWQVGLGVVALTTGGLAWILVALADVSWRKKAK